MDMFAVAFGFLGHSMARQRGCESEGVAFLCEDMACMCCMQSAIIAFISGDMFAESLIMGICPIIIPCCMGTGWAQPTNTPAAPAARADLVNGFMKAP
jgi:hypothetical protein